MLIYLHKFFVYILVIGNFIAHVAFATSCDADWEILFIWSFGICFVAYGHFVSIFWTRLFCQWANNYKTPLTIGFILIFLIELVSILIRVFSLTTRLAINTFSGTLYIVILNRLLFSTSFETNSVIFNFIGYITTTALCLLIWSELIKIAGQCILYVALSFYYLSALEN